MVKLRPFEPTEYHTPNTAKAIMIARSSGGSHFGANRFKDDGPSFSGPSPAANFGGVGEGHLEIIGALFCWFQGRLMNKEAEMSNYSLLLDVAKVRQADVAREVEIARIKRELKLNRKAIKTAKKQRISTASLS
jgi:hypothetical protein